jgi:hypothetical protein
MRRLLIFAFCLSFSISSSAQNRNDWQSLSQLKPGDLVHLSLVTGKSFTATFQNWSADQLTVGTTSANKGDVREVDQYRKNGEWSRGKRALLGGLIGFGGGFAIGEAICHGRCWAPSGVPGAIVGGGGAFIGAAVGVSLPHHDKEVLYVAK